MSTHKHTIARNATSTGTATVPDMSTTQKTWNEAVNGRLDNLEASMVNVLAAIAKLEGTSPPPPSPPPGNVPPINLQTAINAAAPGATINATNGVYSGYFTINKALTLVGGTINFPAGHVGILVTASNVILDGVTINGSQYAHWNGGDFGVNAYGSQGSPLTGLIIRNCHISSLGKEGIEVKWVTGAVITNNLIEDCCYAGIIGFSMVDGSITLNTVRRIGYTLPPAELPEGADSYGIMLNDQGTPCSSDVIVDGNTVEDVPNWHGLNTHGGQRITFSNNIVRRCRRGLFITSSPASGAHATAIVVSGNQLLSPGSIALATTPVTLAAVYGATFTGNIITGWGNGKTDPGKPWFDYQGQSTGLVDGGGNVVTP